MMKKTTKAQQRILEVFYRERKYKSLGDIKVTELCKQAEVSHSCFYKYYTDIYDLNRKQEWARYHASIHEGAERDKIAYDFPRKFADFFWENFPYYQDAEIFIFFENLYYYNSIIPETFQGEVRDSLGRVLPVFIAAQAELISYIGFLRRLKVSELTEKHYAILQRMWESNLKLMTDFLAESEESL